MEEQECLEDTRILTKHIKALPIPDAIKQHRISQNSY